MRTSLRTTVVIAVIAAIAIAGTAGAARLITGRQIQNGSIGLADLSKSAKRALRGNQGPSGPAGPPGVAGPQGPAGLVGLHVVTGPSVTMCADTGIFADCQVQAAVAVCPSGEVATGGHGFTPAIYAGGVASATGYAAIAANDLSVETTVRAQVYCARLSGASVARRRTASQMLEARLRAVRRAFAARS
jgi:hypothetical protein